MFVSDQIALKDAVISCRDARHAGTSPATTPSSAESNKPVSSAAAGKSISMLKPSVDKA
jgi:hypothetical protein